MSSERRKHWLLASASACFCGLLLNGQPDITTPSEEMPSVTASEMGATIYTKVSDTPKSAETNSALVLTQPENSDISARQSEILSNRESEIPPIRESSDNTELSKQVDQEIERLTAENNKLQKIIETLRTTHNEPSKDTPVTGTSIESASEAREFVLLSPNSDGIIELDLALFDSPSIGEVNPFVQRYQQKTGHRTLELRITSLASGPNPSVMLNKHLLGMGQSYEGFIIWSIEADGIRLRRDAFLLTIPMMEKPVSIRMP